MASLKLRKCEFAKGECEWLGLKIRKDGFTPLVRKTQSNYKQEEEKIS